MTSNFQKTSSAPQCQLSKMGTASSFAILLNEVESLPASEFADLEEDLSFYAETGLIGVQMSRLLDALCQNTAEAA